MELTIREQPADHLRRRVLEPVYQELTAEITVPERLPDIARVVDAFGTVLVQEKRCEDGTATATGGIQAGVLYVPEEGELQTLEAWLPFNVRKSVDAQDGCLVARTWLKSIDARVINARKALIRANLGIELLLLEPETLTLAVPENVPESLQLRQNTYPALLPVDCGEQEFRVQDELRLPDSGPAVERILKWELRPTVEESRMIGNKAVFKGSLIVQVLFLGTDGSVNTYVGQIPYSQYAELASDRPDGTVAVFPAIRAAQLETDGQMESRTLLADVSLLAQLCVVEQVTLTLTEDAYAIGAELKPTWQELTLHPLLDAQTAEHCAELELPVKADKVIQISAFPDRPSLRRAGEQAVICSALTGTLLYADADGAIRSKSLRGECAYSDSLHESCRAELSCRVQGEPEAVIQGDQVLLRVPLEFTTELYQDGSWRNLAGGELIELEHVRHPSVVIRRWQGGDLWPLAKQLGATVSDIQEANHLKDQAVPENEILLIPMR